MITRKLDGFTAHRWLIVTWTFVALMNVLIVLGDRGNWINLAISAVFGCLAVLGYRNRVRAEEARQLAEHRRQQKVADRRFWAGVLNESDSAAQRKVAVEMLAYLGVAVNVDPLADPKRSGASLPRPDRAGGRIVSQVPGRGVKPAWSEVQAEIYEMAHQLIRQGLSLPKVIELRQRHERHPQPSSPKWIAACEMLEDLCAEAAGYRQEEEEIHVRTWSGAVDMSYRIPSGPTPREQLLADAKWGDL
jgi:hypothetical protein